MPDKPNRSKSRSRLIKKKKTEQEGNDNFREGEQFHRSVWRTSVCALHISCLRGKVAKKVLWYNETTIKGEDLHAKFYVA